MYVILRLLYDGLWDNTFKDYCDVLQFPGVPMKPLYFLCSQVYYHFFYIIEYIKEEKVLFADKKYVNTGKENVK